LSSLTLWSNAKTPRGRLAGGRRRGFTANAFLFVGDHPVAGTQVFGAAHYGARTQKNPRSRFHGQSRGTNACISGGFVATYQALLNA
jgi:hypothetical protein